MGRIKNQHGPGVQPELCGQPAPDLVVRLSGQPRALGRPRTSVPPWLPLLRKVEATEHEPQAARRA